MIRSRVIAGALFAIVPLAAACSSPAPEVSDDAVTIFVPYQGAEAAMFTADMDGWADQMGIDVRVTGTGNLASDVAYRVTNADPPDIALLPQPGLMRTLYDDGQLEPLSPEVEAVVDQNYRPAAQELGQVDGVQVGIPFRTTVKSLVWYRPSQFEQLGLEPPTSVAELDELVDAIGNEGITPWCMGIEAQRSTGWVATDWVEDLIVRQWGRDVYEDWVEGEVPFSDERIEESFLTYRMLALQPGRVDRGLAGVLSTSVRDAHEPLFASPPGCLLYKQASFALGWMPPDLVFGDDIDFFVFPAVESEDAAPVVVGVDLAVAFDTRPEVQTVMAYLASPDAVHTWTRTGGFISGLSALGPSAYPIESDRRIAEVVSNAETVIVDGSDAMPAPLGTDVFWEQIRLWLVGSITYDELAETMDETRTEG